MFFILLALDFIMYGAAVLLFSRGQTLYGWIALAGGVLCTVAVFLYYRWLKKNKEKDDSWADCCDLMDCADCVDCADCAWMECAPAFRPLRKVGDCDCLPDCDCGPDCHCAPDCN